MVTTITTKRVTLRSEGSSVELWTIGGPRIGYGCLEQITGPRRSQLALPSYLIACSGSRSSTAADFCYLKRQRAVKRVPCFPPRVTVPAVTTLGNGNSSSARTCAVCWLATVRLPSEPEPEHPGSVTPITPMQASASKVGAGAVVPTISASLQQQHLIHLALPGPPLRYPVDCPLKPALRVAS